MVRNQAPVANTFIAVAISVFIALVLNIMPVSDMIYFVWPDWVPVVLIYWALSTPNRVGPWTGFVVGLLLEALKVWSFGVLALGLAVLVFTVNRTHLQMRVLSIWQQMLVVGILVALYRVLTGWVYGLISDFDFSQEYFYPVVGSMLIWPFLLILLHELKRAFGIR